MAHCPDKTHTMIPVPGTEQQPGGPRQVCTTCGFAPCLEIEHDWEVHPQHVQVHPPKFLKICVKCKERRVWAPEVVGQSVGDRGTTESHYNRLAKSAGHPQHEGTKLAPDLASFVEKITKGGK